MRDNWAVGQTIYVVPTDKRWGRPRTATIAKIGRVYFTDDRGVRFNLDNGFSHPEGYSSTERAWPSREACEAFDEAKTLHAVLMRQLKFDPNPGVTVDDIRAAAKLLRVKLP